MAKRGVFGSGLALAGGASLAILIQVLTGSAAYSDGDAPVAFNVDPQEEARLNAEAATCHADVNCFIRHMVTYAGYSKGYYEASVREMHAVVRNSIGVYCQNSSTKILERTECYKDALKAMIDDASGLRAARTGDPDHNSGDSLMAEMRQQNNWMLHILEPICGAHPGDACFDANSSALLVEVTDAHNAMVGSFLNMMRWSVMSKKCDDAAGADACHRAKEWKPTDFLVANANSVRYRPSAPLPGPRGRTVMRPDDGAPAPTGSTAPVPPPSGPIAHGPVSPSHGSHPAPGGPGHRGHHPGDSSSSGTGSQNGNGGTGGPGNGYGTHGDGTGGGAPTGPAHPAHPGAGGAGPGGIGAPTGAHHTHPSVAGPTGAPAPSGTFHPVPGSDAGPTGPTGPTGRHRAPTGPTGASGPTGVHATTGAHATTGVHASTGVHAVTGAVASTGVMSSTGALASTGAAAPSGAIAPSGAAAPSGALATSGPFAPSGAVAASGATAGTGGHGGHGGASGVSGGSGGVAGSTGTHGGGGIGGVEGGDALDCSPENQGRMNQKKHSTSSMADRLDGASYIYACSVRDFYNHNRSAVFLAGASRRISHVFQSTILSCSEINEDLTWMDTQLSDVEQTSPSHQVLDFHEQVRRLQSGGCGSVMTEFSNRNSAFIRSLCSWIHVTGNAEPGCTLGFPEDIANCR